MQRPILILALMASSVAASAPVRPAADPLDADLARARAEAGAAEREAKRLAGLAGQQRDAAARLRARHEAAAQEIAAAEAQISAADAEARVLAARLKAQRDALRREQAPAVALLAGLALMGQRPPILTLADEGGTDEFVRLRLLLDSTLPVIRKRTADLSRRLAAGRRLEAQLASARQSRIASRQELRDRQNAFAALEQQALRSADQSGLAALGAGDVVLARSESGEALSAARRSGQSAARMAAEIAALGSPPNRPFPVQNGNRPALDYQLPAAGIVTDGLGSISDSGIRSRGITIATRRGTGLMAPAAGTILFTGPFRTYDGIVIIDHGNGWKSLILNAATDLGKGAKVRAGEPIGRALGPIGVELSRNGRHLSPALIAGSSAALSKRGKSS